MQRRIIFSLVICYLLSSCTIPGSNLVPSRYKTLNAKVSDVESPQEWSAIVRLTPESLDRINKTSVNKNYSYRLGASDVIRMIVHRGRNI